MLDTSFRMLAFFRSQKKIILSALCAAFLGFSGPSVEAQILPESITLRAGEGERVLPRESLLTFVHVEPIITLSSQEKAEIESLTSCPVAPAFHCDIAVTKRHRYSLKGDIRYSAEHEMIAQFLQEFARDANRSPTDARFGISQGALVTVSESKTGEQVRLEEALVQFSTALLSENPSPQILNLPTESTPPKIASGDAARLGLTGLVGEGTTNFAGSPKNRVFNIKRALQDFEGILVAPGEEFSFVEFLGPVDGEHGYLPELVIKNNKTEPEFGGGICQVSTTVFRAAINAGLKITERRNHAYPVKYYKPYGMDATIYIPKPDLRFLNNTSGYILFQPTVEGAQLTFQIFGTPDGRAVSVDGPHITESNPDGSMRTFFVQTVTDRNGSVMINDTFRSNYKSPALFPHPGEEVFTEKPKDWSKRQWEEYLKTRPAGR